MVKNVAIVTGGARGIGRGITKVLADSGRYDGIIVTFNKNAEAAEAYAVELQNDSELRVVTVGGDLTLVANRDAIFDAYDREFSAAVGWSLSCVVHNAGQYVGITSPNEANLDGMTLKFGDGSLLGNDKDRGPDFSHMAYYQKLYGEAFVDICERSIHRMKGAREQALKDGAKYQGSIIGISSPGCNAAFKVTPGYDMPGSGKCIMEYASRQYAVNIASLGINCNVIVPGFTRSDAWDAVAEKMGSTADAFLEKMKTKIPCGEFAEASDIGDLVAFLSGPGGGRFMTGLSLRCDGGRHLT